MAMWFDLREQTKREKREKHSQTKKREKYKYFTVRVTNKDEAVRCVHREVETCPLSFE